MNTTTTEKKTERSYKGWIILALILLLGGLSYYTFFGRGASRDGQSGVSKPALAVVDGKSNDDVKVEAESKDSIKTAAAPPADAGFAEELKKLQAQMAEQQQKLDDAEARVRDRDKELATRSKELKDQHESFENRVATAKAEAKTEFEKSQATKEEERRAALRKSKEVVIQDVDKNNLGEIQMDKNWKKGFWVPLTTNDSGNPSPFGPAGAAPRKLVRRGAEWKVVKDYPLESGQTVDAWAIVLGKDGQP